MAWRLAESLVVLRNQIDAMAPRRSKASDGTIGDAAHGSRCSRHNPNDFGVVTALDITHDPARGCDIHAIADHVRRFPHPELSYLISLGRIAGRSTGWAWHRYTGSNPHNIHVHFGVGQGSDCDPQPPYDSPAPWNIGVWIPPPEDDMNIAELRHELTTRGTPTRSAIRSLARAGTRDALSAPGDPARTEVRELVRLGVRDELSIRGTEGREAVVELIRQAVRDDEETRAALLALIREALDES
jgi:hypothetical protein